MPAGTASLVVEPAGRGAQLVLLLDQLVDVIEDDAVIHLHSMPPTGATRGRDEVLTTFLRTVRTLVGR